MHPRPPEFIRGHQRSDPHFWSLRSPLGSAFLRQRAKSRDHRPLLKKRKRGDNGPVPNLHVTERAPCRLNGERRAEGTERPRGFDARGRADGSSRAQSHAEWKGRESNWMGAL